MVAFYAALLAPIAVIIADGWWILRRSLRAGNEREGDAILVATGTLFAPILWLWDTRTLCLEALRLPAPIATGAACLTMLFVFGSLDAVSAITAVEIQSAPLTLATFAAYWLFLPGAHAVAYAIRWSRSRRHKEPMQMEDQQ